jgi:triacylglycerol esterase/lipase EstA (alpha/beta hydrolase family)
VLSGLAPARRRLLLGAVAVLLVAVVSGVAAVLVRAAGSASFRPVAQDRPGPVLLVPGYGGSTTGLEVLARRLRAAGRDATVVGLPGGGTGDMAEQAKVVDAAVHRALARTGAPSVDVVGYSAGGVVARLWVRDDGGRSPARRVVTLGSPHHGAGLASLAGSLLPGQCPAACRQLVPDSPLLTRLNSGDETPDGPAWVSIWSTVDEVVTPPDSARLDGALDLTVQGVCPGSRVAHSELPTDRVVQGIVLAELGSAPPAPLSTADCARLSS